MKFSIHFILLGLFSLSIFAISEAYGEKFFVEIPFGAYNPELNTPAEEWFTPTTITIKVGDQVFWYNADREGHTITSGQGSGRFGWMGDDFGKADGIFDSGRFMPEESWSYTFDEVGAFQYFCTIHPWMEGFVIVEPLIPDYPQDAAGNKIKLPVIGFTGDKLIEIDLTWEPNVIKTHEKITLVYQTYDPETNSNLDNISYDITVTQNGKEIFQDDGITSVGGDYRNIIFDEAGPVEIKFENLKSWGSSGIESAIRDNPGISSLRTIRFSTIVYENPDLIEHTEMITQPKETFRFYYEIAILIIVIPGILFVIVLYQMKSKPKQSNISSSPV